MSIESYYWYCGSKPLKSRDNMRNKYETTITEIKLFFEAKCMMFSL